MFERVQLQDHSPGGCRLLEPCLVMVEVDIAAAIETEVDPPGGYGAVDQIPTGGPVQVFPFFRWYAIS